ncbi:MAG: hypothetical protein M1832_003490 [Thelocarpon impressellum]|nr:MAG: hypothetical protein M1832_003490 [Thelocarpon impressellum]
MTSTALRYVASSGKATKKPLGAVHLACHVKPGASSNREGITAVTPSEIELCVAAQAREGEANKAVRELISEVLGVSKSRVEIAKGYKSRDKTVVVSEVDAGEDPDAVVDQMRQALESAVDG